MANEKYHCSNPACPIAFRDEDKETKICPKCGWKVKKVGGKEGEGG